MGRFAALLARHSAPAGLRYASRSRLANRLKALSRGLSLFMRRLLMLNGWRIVRAARAATAFDGEGARLFPGRWNLRGTPMVYVSAHQSLAALETLVHWQPLQAREKFKAFLLEWPERITEHLPRQRLPRDWRMEPPPESTRRIGDRWARDRRSAVLAVPSTLAPADLNFLLNPVHTDFKLIKIGKAIDFDFDPRLLKRGGRS